MAGTVLWTGEGISLAIGTQILLNDAKISIHAGERVALVGRNGSGKSTFMRIVAGTEPPSAGEITCARGLRIACMEQDCTRYHDVSVRDAIAEGLAYFNGIHRQLDALRAGSAEQEKLERILTLHNAWNPAHKIEVVAQKLNLPPLDSLCGVLSGGELRKVMLARAIAAEPDLLLLDEPTNHLDIGAITWMEDFLANYRGTCLFVTHDRCFLDRIATRIVELDHGKFYSCEGSYADFLAAKAAREYREDQAEYKRQSFLRREIEWVRRSPKARLRRNLGRIKRYEETAAQSAPERIGSMELIIPKAGRLGNQVVQIENVSHAIGGKPLIRDFSFEFEAGQRVGIVGPNGAGKTTLLRLMTQQIMPDRGKIEVAPTVVFNYIGQAHLELNPSHTVLEEIGEGHEFINLGDERVSIRSYLRRFLFEDDRVNTRIDRLSGGERARIALAKILKSGGSFLILDEPTNDLDLPSMRVLEEALVGYSGCLAVVSHDRYFLNRVCTHIIAFEPDGHLFAGPGDYDYYLEHRASVRQAAAAPAPKKDAPPPRPKAPPKKLSYKEERELAELEPEIERLEARVSEIEAIFSAPDFFANHGPESAALQNELNTLRAKIDSLYARWDELEQKKQALQS